MRWLDRLFQSLIDALAVAAGAIFVAITVALTLNVATRALFRANLYAMVDLIELGLMTATFLAAPWVLNRKGHVAVDIVLTNLPPRARARMELAVAVMGALLSAALFWASLKALLIAFARGSMMRGVFAAPEWMLLAVPTLCGALLTIEFVRQMARRDAAGRRHAGL